MIDIPDDASELDGVITDPLELERRRFDYINDVSERISEYGYTMQGVIDSPPWAYTVGLTMLDLPELYVVGLDLDMAQYVLAECVALLRAGSLKVGVPIQDVLDGDYHLMAIEMTDLSGLTLARLFAGQAPMRALQICWPDKQGHWPWESGYTIPPDFQPLRGER